MPLNSPHTVSVVHLVWLPFGIETFRTFLDSYHQHPADYDHDLILLFNGVKEESDCLPFLDLVQQYGISYRAFYKSGGQDLEAYFWITPQTQTEYILFLNSYATILSDGWLRHYMNAFNIPGVGIVGATGTCHSLFTAINHDHSLAWDRQQTFGTNFRKYKLLLKNNLLYRFYFKAFPNPHLRTNAFMMKRDTMLRLHFKASAKKIDAYRFESGRSGMTVQVQNMGLTAFVVDKFGSLFTMDKWFDSKTFWTDEQANLLIGDNQTAKFMAADSNEKLYYQKLAWGK